MTELTHYLNFHNEGSLALAAIRSALEAKEQVESSNHRINIVAILDNADEYTRQIILKSKVIEDVIETNFGDLGSARNFAASSGESEFLSFQDGDDLIGDQWLKEGLLHISLAENQKNKLILHPEFALYFYEGEYDFQLVGKKSFFMRYAPSNTPYLDPKVLLFNNIYTSNFMASRALVLENSLPAVDKVNNWGVEDWSWNSQTLARGILHDVVRNTIHAVRVKEENSLGLENARKNLLPDTREYIEKVINVIN